MQVYVMSGANFTSKEQRSARSMLIPWLALSLFCLFQVSLQSCVGIFADALHADFNLDAAQLGIISSVFFYPYVVMQIPVGWIFDRFSVRKISLAATALVAFSCIGLSFARSFEQVLLFRALTGLGSCFAFVGVMTAIKKWYPRRLFATMTGMTEALVFASVAATNLLLSQIVASAGWRVAMLVAFFILLGIFAGIWCFVPEDSNATDGDEQASALPSLWSTFKQVLKGPSIWIAGLYGFFSFAFLSLYVSLWGIPFLLAKYEFGLVTATAVMSMVLVGGAIGCPIVGVLTSRVRAQNIASIGSLINCLLAFWLTQGPSLGILSLLCCHLLLGIFSSVYIICFVVVAKNVPEHIQGAAIGMTNMIKMSSGPVLQPLLGLILSYLANRVVLDSAESYSQDLYAQALLLFPICTLSALLLSFFLPRAQEAIEHQPTAQGAELARHR